MALESGTKVRLYADNVAIARATDCSIELSAETESTSDKDSEGGWVEIEVGDLRGTGTSQFFTEEAQGSFDSLYTKFSAKQSLVVKMTGGVVGNRVLTGTAFITALSMNGVHKQKVTASVTFTFSGAVSKTVVS